MGATVQAVQRRLIALGFPLPRYGPDGDLGDETFDALDAALDELEQRRGASGEAQPVPIILLDRAAFFAHIRKSDLFPNGPSQNQVQGFENLLSVASMPEDSLSAVRGARSPVRDRWYELKQLIEKSKSLEALREILARMDLDGDARFAFVVDALSRKKPSSYARAEA
jgi:hypothetical protein